jgi:translation initiation factor 5B
MAPKKKGSKKANDDWEAELGESIAPPGAAPDSTNGDAADDGPAGGLMGLMRKNKEKRKKKGITEDFVQGEDAPGAEQPASEPLPDLAAKAPEEAAMDDEFALPEKKGKGKQQAARPEPPKDDDETPAGEDSGRVLTKAEKEKLKKEREKQRKKEQVSRQNTPDRS